MQSKWSFHCSGARMKQEHVLRVEKDWRQKGIVEE